MNAADGSWHGQPGSGPAGTLDSGGGAPAATSGSAADGPPDDPAGGAPDSAIDGAGGGASARPGQGDGAPAGSPAGRAVQAGQAARAAPGGAIAGGLSRPVVRHLALLAIYLAAGVAVTWPIASYITGRLPKTRDVANYVWGLQWTAHQVIHLGNPFFTTQMAAPAGIQLAFGTTMPLAGLVMTPVTLAFGPSAAFTLLTIVTPGLACYVMYRAARLWLAGPGAIAAGALFGLSSMLDWQDWYHLNIALGTLFLPMTLEAAVRLRRRPSRRGAVILGAVIGASVLVNQESAVLAVILAVVILLPWLLRGSAAAAPAGSAPPAAPGPATTTSAPAATVAAPGAAPATAAPALPPARARLALAALGALVAAVLASPQLIAMIQQALAGGASIKPALLTSTYGLYGAGLPTLFAPSPRLGTFGMQSLAAAYTYDQPSEGVATYGVLLSALALAGLAISWRRRPARLFALLWLCCSVVALGSALILGTSKHIPFAEDWQGTRVSWLMPFTWLMHVPVLSGLREADRFALFGLVGAAILAGAAVDWLARHARQVIIVVAVLAVFEAGWPGTGWVGTMPTALPALDGPIAADHSHSIVLDIPYGLRGGIPLFGSSIIPQEQLLATSDSHPRAISYTAWVPEPTVRAIEKHPFYVRLAAAQRGRSITPAQLIGARRDARRMDIGWAVVWRQRSPAVLPFLIAVGFRFDYRADGISVYRPDW